MFDNRVYFIGHRYDHHAQHSGYEAFGRYVGTMIQPPVNFRWISCRPLNQFVSLMTGHERYSVGAHITELHALKHMLCHRNCLYHILYGDTDLWLLGKANKLTGNRLVASFHEPPDHLKELGIIEQVAKYLDAAILVSKSQRAYFEEFLPADHVFVVPHGVNTDFFHPGEIFTDPPTCITVGGHLRDFNSLKQAVHIVWEVNPQVRFLAIGTRIDKESYFPEVNDERIQFLDGVSDDLLLQSYQKSKVAVFSFKEATANNAVLEAMASGLPVVATKVGRIDEYISDGTGILCPPRDPQAMAMAILRIINDSNLQKAMSVASRQRALQLDFCKVAEQMCQIYSKILSTN